MRELVSLEEHWKKLSDDDFILVRYERVGSEVKYMLIVYFSIISDKPHQIFRIDMSHGFLHKDKLFESKKETVKEKIFENPTVEVAWRLVQEIKENWVEMKRKFIENFGGIK